MTIPSLVKPSFEKYSSMKCCRPKAVLTIRYTTGTVPRAYKKRSVYEKWSLTKIKVTYRLLSHHSPYTSIYFILPILGSFSQKVGVNIKFAERTEK